MPVGLPAERERLAQIMIALGPERAAGMMRALPEAQVQLITSDMATIDLTPEAAKEVLQEFTREFLQRTAAPAGLDLAKKVLTNLYGADKAREMAREIDPVDTQPFGWMTTLDPEVIAIELAGESPSTIALALAHLDANYAVKILRKMDATVRADVSMRMASLDTMAPDVITAVDSGLRARLSGRLSEPSRPVEGVTLLVDVLGQASPKTQKAIIESIRGEDEKLAMQVQERLFVFDDLVMLDDAAIQAVLRSIETMDLAFALHSAIEEIQDLIFRNLSERARESLKDEIDYLQNPKQPEVKAAKKRIIAVVRELEESGAIDIARPGIEEEEDDDEDGED